MHPYSLGVGIALYLGFGWEYGDALIKASKSKPPLKASEYLARIAIVFIWPWFVLTQVATHLANW